MSMLQADKPSVYRLLALVAASPPPELLEDGVVDEIFHQKCYHQAIVKAQIDSRLH